MQWKARRLLRDCSGHAETPQTRSGEEAQRRLAESEVPVTEINSRRYRKNLITSFEELTKAA
ncbi:hypothetical protein KZX50_17700 [Bacillus infantis]|uniref:hypothetical protein n=1 Tax=Bacillus infantis TaxID=324767 RepID=UPI002003775E|nr:hypothetical protein [Bacillus infantis]MCK6207277.1 hypothetical protein [Bacillus infantis]